MLYQLFKRVTYNLFSKNYVIVTIAQSDPFQIHGEQFMKSKHTFIYDWGSKEECLIFKGLYWTTLGLKKTLCHYNCNGLLYGNKWIMSCKINKINIII
jgi:hypothetical protein